MKTPIYDFVRRYKNLRPARFHMPGHKGRGPLGCEELDLTEIPGADSLYEAAGIIAESEANASRLFGCPTFYSTEGSSHCIRAMLLLAMQYVCRDKPCLSADSDKASGSRQQATGEDPVGGGVLDAPNVSDPGSCGASRTPPPTEMGKRFRVLAARNVHKSFLSAAALLDLDVAWLPAKADGSYLSADPTPEALDAALAETGAQAVYLTCPDYLGFLPDLRPLARVCHARGALLLVDNAHGAYLRFLPESRHPMDLGADLCCDSAHKTLPVLTGGAYLHVKATEDGGCEAAGFRQTSPACRGGGPPTRAVEGSSRRQSPSIDADTEDGFLAAPGMTERESRAVRDALALFGSSSPSYLILQSLDLANPCLEALPAKLAAFLPKVEALKARLTAAGWRPVGDEPLKLTLALSPAGTAKTSPACRGGGPAARPVEGCLPSTAASSGLALAAALEQQGIFCEFADPDYIVFMLSPAHTEEELARLEQALAGTALCRPAFGTNAFAGGKSGASASDLPASLCSIREAMLSPAVTVPASESLGRILARPCVSCPPAVPILMPGERITETELAAFERYGIKTVSVFF